MSPDPTTPIYWRAQCQRCGWQDPDLYDDLLLSKASAASHQCPPLLTPATTALLSIRLLQMALDLYLRQLKETPLC